MSPSNDNDPVLDAVTASEVPIAGIEIEGHSPLRIYPRVASEDFDTAKPFSYERLVEVLSTTDASAYDPDRRLIQFEVRFPAPSASALLNAREKVALYFHNSSGAGSPVRVEFVDLQPLPVVGYEVWLDVPGRKIILERTEPTRARTYDVIKIKGIVDDDYVHEQLVKFPDSATVIVVPLHYYNLVNTDKYIAEQVDEGVSRAFEELGGLSDAIVDRKIKQKLQRLLNSSMLVELHLSSTGENAEVLGNLLSEYFDKLSPLSLDEIGNDDTRVLIYGPGEAKVEIAPDEFRELTTSWKKESDIKEFAKKTWDNLEEFATKSDNYEKFHDEVHEYYKGAGSSAAKAGFLKLSAAASMSLHVEKKTDELTESERRDVEDAYKKLRNSGTDEQEILEKTVEEWTGRNYHAGSEVKTLDLYRVSAAEVRHRTKITAMVVTPGDTQARGREWEFDLYPKTPLMVTPDATMATYLLWRDGSSLVMWEAPDRNIYELDTSLATPGEWYVVVNGVGRPVMAYLTQPGQDGELVVTLEGSNVGIAATLLHEEDDMPRRLYYSTDAENDNPLGVPAFQLRCEGVEGCPVELWAHYRVLCVELRE